MLRLFSLAMCLALTVIACKNDKKEQELLEKEAEIIEKEKKLEKESETFIEHEAAVELNPEVQLNLIYCENDSYIVRVDRLKSNDVRYMAWNKPKSTTERPDLILLDGEIEKQGSGGGYHFIFTNGHHSYIVENNLMGETMDSMGVFLKLMEGEEEVYFSKMTDLKLK
ncbi:hypothetical protein [Cytophaga sp. FL35]|uniref:hypothetical protein n=1 Tax=Cytophaga sp. FL35 TaxID=1904456 RepID=UPI0016537852|nr:hypothetical protein [Cytophaga sp. FL35]MBC6998612.1 hypothetical protein [Cytophaga sp. FL35]